MADLSIIVPLATRNIVTNPSIEDGTDGWTANGSVTLTRTFDRARFGIASLRVVTDGIAENEGTFFRATPSTQNTRYFGSVYVRGSGKIRMRLIDQLNGNVKVSDTQVLSDERWIRLSVMSQTGPVSSDDLRLYIETVDGIQGTTFYVDAAQIEQGDFLTSYCDGEQPGCRWNIIKNASDSTRDAQERSGGRVVDITDDDIYVTILSGVGMPPLRNTLQEFPFVEGAFFQRTKTLARVIDITFNIKDEEAQARPTNELDKLHQIRQTLLDIIKPDLVRDSQAFTFIYTETDKPSMFIKARYDAGFESNHDIRNKFFDSFTIRLLAEDPFWFEDNQEVLSLDFQDGLETHFTMGRIDGQWTNLNFGVGGASPFGIQVYAFNNDTGRVYIGGFFDTVNNDAGAIDPLRTANRIAEWDGTQFSPLGGGLDDAVRAIIVDSNGDVYAGGDFRNISGGPVAEHIARWEISTSTWNPLGAGLGGVGVTVSAIAIHPNGDIYVGGTFREVAGDPANTMNRIGIWRPSSGAWIPIGGANNGLNDDVNSIVISKDGATVYVGGGFTDENNNPGKDLNHACAYDVATDVFSALATGLTATGGVTDMVLDSRDNLYVVGSFQSVDSGADTPGGIAKWDGTSWLELTQSATGTIFDIAIDKDDLLYIGGSFTVIDGAPFPERLAIFNGAVFAHLDGILDQPSQGLLDEVKVTIEKDIYISAFNDDNSLAAHINTVNNIGTAETFPIFYIQGPGFVRWIENQSIGAILFMNYQLLEDEVLTVDTRNVTITSSLFGEVIFAVLPNSNLGSFMLLPGENLIVAFMTDDVDAVMQIRFTPRHWSVDAVGL